MSTGRRSLIQRAIGLVIPAAVGLCWAPAAMAEIGPAVNAAAKSYPAHLAPGGSGMFRVEVENLGNAPTTAPVVARMTLPSGIRATGLASYGEWECPDLGVTSVVTCTLLYADPYWSSDSIPPHTMVPSLNILIEAASDLTSVQAATVAVSGGGGAGDTTEVTATISDEPAPFGVPDFAAWALNSDGTPARQAGGHPDLTTDIGFATQPGRGGQSIRPVANIKRIEVDLPPGLVGDPTAVPTCKPSVVSVISGYPKCPAESQVGVATITTPGVPGDLPLTSPVFPSPVFNIEPPVGVPGRFAFNFSGVVINLDASVRSGGDYGITASIDGISQTLATVSSRVTLWGVPASPVNDAQRFVPGEGVGGAKSTSPPKAFLTAPTSCTGRPLVATARASSWAEPDRVVTASAETNFDGQPNMTQGCESLPFDPGFQVRSESPSKRGAPAGLGIDLTIPQSESPNALSSAHLKTAKVILPEGMAVNPSSAQGLGACTPAQIALDASTSPRCPQDSKIGTVEIDTPLLREPLRGSVFLASQRQNPFGTTLAIYFAVEGSGVVVKLAGRIDADSRTGRVTATFDDNPQMPFERLSMHFKTGPRAPLSLPATCGPATTSAVLTPWSGTPPVTVNTSFEVSADGNGKPCPARGFAPTFTAGTTNAAGGADSTFVLGFSRTDDDQELGGLTVNMPKGLLARIASVELCGEAAAAAGSCGEASKIGNVTTAAGAGPNPLSLPGRVYVTGPYKGAPFGLSIVVPAVAGPFDLGTVVVRAAIYVDRNTAELRVVSDPLPTILEGIPLQVRLVDVRVDRPGFIFNPTNCGVTRVSGQLSSVQGAIANVASRFQVGGCASLPFRPKMTLRVGKKGRTASGLTTPLDVTLSMTRGQANNRSVQVILPKALNSRLEVVNRRSACTIEQFRADRCPTVVGVGTAVTPLLRDPLRGPAYFVYNPDRRLPDLVVRLKGQVDVDLTGKVTIPKNLSLQTTFDLVPDVPITKFSLRLVSGRNGPIGIVSNLCSARTRKSLKANLSFIAQNNKKVVRDQSMQVAGCGKARARGRAGNGRRAASRGSSRRGGSSR